MEMKTDYYALLARAVAALDRDSFAARGAIYDREQKALLRRLFTADPPISDEVIEREQQAFRAAIRRIEFGEDDHVPLVPQRDPALDEAAAVGAPPAPAATPPSAPIRSRRVERDWVPEPMVWPEHREAQRPPPRKPVAEPPPAPVHWSQRRPTPEAAAAPTHWSQRQPAPQLPWQELEATLETALKDQPVPAASAVEEEPAPAADSFDAADAVAIELPKRRSITGRVLRRALFAALLLGIGIIGYDVANDDIEFPLLTKLWNFANKGATTAKAVMAAPSQALIYDSNPPNTEGSKSAGSAVWRVRAEPASAQRPATSVLQFEVKIPDRATTVQMSMRPAGAGSTMSHLIELRFLREDGQPDADVDNIASIVMTTVEQQRPHVMIGRVAKVQTGVFYFGLSGVAGDSEQNLQSLKDQTWFDIPLTYRNGTSAVLAVEKGASGEQAVDEALSEWARVAAAPSDR